MNFRNKLIALETIVKKEVRRFTRIWVQTIVPPVITMSLYFIIFGNLIGKQLGAISGFTYMQFIVPGLIMMSVITNSYMNVCSSFFSTKFQKSVEELLVSPTPNTIIILGYCVGGVVRGLLVGFVVVMVSLFFTKMHIHNLFYLLSFAVLTATVFSLGGLTNAIFAQKFDDISIIPTFVITPLTYLGGVFYSIEQLPLIWQTVSKLNPILYMINGFRYGFLGISDVSLTLSISILIFFIALLFLMNLSLLRKGSGLRT
ncbi:MAG: ABC transporter permease [Oligoflexales bacterium]